MFNYGWFLFLGLVFFVCLILYALTLFYGSNMFEKKLKREAFELHDKISFLYGEKSGNFSRKQIQLIVVNSFGVRRRIFLVQNMTKILNFLEASGLIEKVGDKSYNFVSRERGL